MTLHTAVLMLTQLSYCCCPGWPGHAKLTHVFLGIVAHFCPLDTARDFFTGSDEKELNWKRPIPTIQSSTPGCEISLSCFSENKRMLPLGPY